MKLPTRHRPLLLLAALLLGLGTWTAWVAARTETGWCVLRIQWYNATVGWLAGEYQPIGQRDPDQQADFWLAETDRILAEYPDDPQLAMGAAWLLDSPGLDFVWRRTRLEEWAGMRLTSPDGEPGRAVRQFEKKTSARCLELAARATQLEPENVDWWRQRALLLFPELTFGLQVDPPRASDWRELLAEYGQHDPDNALYDYLAADRFWEDAEELEDNHKRADDDGRCIAAAMLREDGNEHFRRGVRKRQLAAGNGAHAATLALLGYSRVPRSEWPRIVGSRLQHIRAQGLSRDVMTWPGLQAAKRLERGERTGAIELLREPIRVLDQVATADDEWPMEPVRSMIGQSALFKLREAVCEYPGLVSREEIAEIEACHETAFLEMKLFIDACQTAHQQRIVPEKPPVSVAVGWTFVAQGASLLAAIGLILWGVGMALMRRHLAWRPRLGLLRNLVCCVVAFALTFVVLGLAPAGIITPALQKVGLTGVSATIFVVLLAWGVRIWYTRRRLQFSIRTMLWITLGVASLSALVATLIMADPFWFARLASSVEVPARGFGEQTASVMGQVFDADRRPWEWAVLQWAAYGGPYATLGVWLLLVVAWYLLMRRRGTEEEVAAYRTAPRRARFGALSSCIARSALGLAACLLVVHLALTPWLLQVAEADYQFNMAYLRDPLLGEREVRAVMAEMRADAEGMALLREDVKEQVAAMMAEREADEAAPE